MPFILSGSTVSTTGTLIHYVAAEYGAARLSGLSLRSAPRPMSIFFNHCRNGHMVGKNVMMIVQRYENEKMQMYGKIMSKW